MSTEIKMIHGTALPSILTMEDTSCVLLFMLMVIVEAVIYMLVLLLALWQVRMIII